MLIDNERIIKIAHLYTDETVNLLKKTLESKVNECNYKIDRLDTHIDEEVDKLRRLKVGRDDLPDIEQQICDRMHNDYIHVRQID